MWRIAAALFGCWAGAAIAACPAADPASIADLKGYTGEPAEPGDRVTIEGVVTGAFLGTEGLGGFYLQEEGDGELPAGLFVYAPGLDDAAEAGISPGTRVQVEARFGRFHGRYQLDRVVALHSCGEPGVPEPVAVEFPWPVADRARYEGLLVTVPEDMTVTGNRLLARFGVLSLSSGGRLFRPTHAPEIDAEDNRDRRIELDDGSYRANPVPIPYLNPQGTRRVGSLVEDLTGIVTFAFEEYRIHPVETVDFREANPRPKPPSPPAAGQIRLAAFNMENYFVTLGQRGADSAAALARQRGKLVSAFLGMQADVVVLSEVENDLDAVADFVEHVNRAAPDEQQYRAVQGPPDPGDDAIRLAILYRPDRVAALGPAVSDTDEVHKRPPVVAGVRALEGDLRLGVAGIHFKSKTGCPEEGDVDEGQGCWNRLRVAQAEALIAFMRDRAAAAQEDRWLIIGDLNAYGAEDPARSLADSGFEDLMAGHVPPDQRYSYVFRGESGYLDHAWASASLKARVAAVQTWPINADEPVFLAYDQPWTQPDPYRSSDHDPIMVDLWAVGPPSR